MIYYSTLWWYFKYEYQVCLLIVVNNQSLIMSRSIGWKLIIWAIVANLFMIWLETLSPLLVLSDGDPLVTGGFPSQRASDVELWCFLFCLGKLLNQQLSCQLVEISWHHYTPRFNEVERGVYWYHLVRLSVCGQHRVRSVSSTILIRSISYLHILSSNFRRCVACNAHFEIKKFWRIF